MAKNTKFDQEAAFKSIIGQSKEVRKKVREQPTSKEKNKDRVQRSYFLDRDIDKALKRMALDEEKSLTQTINDVLRIGLAEYLSKK